MFSKLLKHDFKSNGALLGILSLCALGAGVLGIFVTRGMLYLKKATTLGNAEAAGYNGLESLLAFIFIGLVVYLVAVQFINIIRFYKSRFTDEGYLTFTLPVNAHQVFLSSFLHILLWLVISVAVLLISIFLIAVVGGWDSLQEYADTFQSTDDYWVNEPGYKTYQWLSFFSTVVTVIYNIVLIMTSITLGSVLAKRHKMLTAIGMYYGINMLIGILESILTLIPALSDDSLYTSSFAYSNTVLGVTIALRVGLAVAGYFVSTGLMKNKLNLP